MGIWKKLFGGAAKSPATVTPEPFSAAVSKGLDALADKYRAKLDHLWDEEDDYWEKKKAQLKSSPNPPDAATRDKNRARAEDLARIAEYHFKCGRFDLARENYERASLLTMDDENLSKKYRGKAMEACRKANKA